MAKTPAFSIKDLGYSVGGNVILDGVTVDIAEGAYLGVIGPNGGGKTTFLKILLGLIDPSEGSVECKVDRARVGYVPQRANAMGENFPATVDEIIRSGQTPVKKNAKALARAIDAAGVRHLLARRIGTLSGGERQRVLIARALAAEPKVIMLDEPTSAVDVKGQEDFFHFVRELRDKLKLTVILVSHDIDVVAHEVDEVLCLNRHMVCHGPTEEVMHHPHFIHGHK
ncbi:MAG: metal ABC transporter ATP-binding protein [Patescibacteria group bacterium]|jgi:zinc transport system ATP-binding protein